MSDRLLLRPAEAAALLAMSRSKVYALAQSGELVGVVRVGGSVRIHRPTLEAWLDEQAGMRRAAPPAAGTAQEVRRASANTTSAA